MKSILCLIIIIAMTGCAAQKEAQYKSVRLTKHKQYHGIKIEVPSTHWEFDLFSGYHETIRKYMVVIPDEPKESARYPYDDIKLYEITLSPVRHDQISAGFVEIDRTNETIHINLITHQGEFWANGYYPLGF